MILAVAGLALQAAEPETNAAAAAAKKAAAYLEGQQNAEGTFGKTKDVADMPGVVGLVIKALAGSPDKLREDNPVMNKAVQYLLSKQNASGAFTLPVIGLENYNTSVAIIALTALENPTHKQALEKAKDFVLKCQRMDVDEKDDSYGGFAYGNVKKTDLSNTAFSLEALKAAGLKQDSPAWKNAVKFISRCQDNSETNDSAVMKGGDDTGAFVYKPGVSEFNTIKAKSGKEYPKPYGNMTYQAVKSLIYCGMDQKAPELQAAFKWIRNNYSVKENPGGEGSQGYYYYVISFAKAFTATGKKEIELADGRKVNWAKDLAAQLISLQKPDGSFVNENKRWMETEPVLSTAYALEALNLCSEALK
jgi:squalene-hopene/tetraprenyl-beta-curcumene cyclase